MYKWSDEHNMMRQAMKDFMAAEVIPNKEALEHGDLPPYDLLRKLFSTFGMDEMAKASFARQIAREKAAAAGETVDEGDRGSGGGDAAMTMIPIIELCRHCPGMVTAMGVSMGLTASAISSKGTIAQKERWVPQLLSLERIGAWAITEPDSGSDAF
ncbi:MAG: acyl-CoA dehydrogenase family protein, partial [Acidobacteria bacterium]|nr:acyl-CoA dehydrogenase family protein [Acidobacteriota bacterium]